MNYKEKIIKKLNAERVNNIYDLYSLAHEIEIEEFKKAFDDLKVDVCLIDYSCFTPVVTVTSQEEPVQVTVVAIRKESDSVVIDGEYYGTRNTYLLADVEKGHLDYLKEFFPQIS